LGVRSHRRCDRYDFADWDSFKALETIVSYAI